MFDIGTSEIVIILLLAIVLIGPKKLPEVARGLGRFLARARELTDDFKDEVQKGIDSEKEKFLGDISDAAPSENLEIKGEDGYPTKKEGDK